MIVVAYHARHPLKWPQGSVDLLAGFGFLIKMESACDKSG